MKKATMNKTLQSVKRTNKFFIKRDRESAKEIEMIHKMSIYL